MFTGEEFFLAGHRIGGERLLPAVAYLEMAREAVARAVGRSWEAGEGKAQNVGLRNLVWLRRRVGGQEPVEVHIVMLPEDGGEVGFEVYSRASASAEEVVHARGVGVVGAAVEAPRLDVEALARRYQQHSYSAEACYAALAGLEIEYGAGHRGIEGLYVEGDEGVARLSLPAAMAAGPVVLHPGVMDSGAQAIVEFSRVPRSGDGTRSWSL